MQKMCAKVAAGGGLAKSLEQVTVSSRLVDNIYFFCFTKTNSMRKLVYTQNDVFSTPMPTAVSSNGLLNKLFQRLIYYPKLQAEII